MAKQRGLFRFIGTIDNLTFYKMLGEYYVKPKSSLTGKQFREWACFEGSRRAGGRFGAGSKLASKVYRGLSRAERRGLYPKLNQLAIQRMHQFVPPDLIEEELRQVIERENGKRRSHGPAAQEQPVPVALNGQGAAKPSPSLAGAPCPQRPGVRPHKRPRVATRTLWSRRDDRYPSSSLRQEGPLKSSYQSPAVSFDG